MKKQSKKNTIPMIFYYEQRQIIILTIIYAIISILVYLITKNIIDSHLSENILISSLTIILMFISLLALGLTVFILLFPQNLAVITDETIKIDHNEPLKWSDVDIAIERKTSRLSHRKIISLILKKNANYKLTFMQKLCKHNIFTPFSIPLYAMDKESQNRIIEEIKNKVPYKTE